MLQVRMGRTGFVANKNGFGALPVQRVEREEAVAILRRARDGGVNYYDTARAYSDSEEKLGVAFDGAWDGIFIATKTTAANPEQFWSDLHTSLRNLRTGCIDLYQFHNPAVCPLPGDGSGLYEAMVQARREGKIRFIGFTNHRLHVARQAVESGLYDTLQFPFSYLSGPEEMDLVALCREKDVGFVAMKALSGGLITDGATAYNWMAGQPHVLPIWGIQRPEELQQFLDCQKQEYPSLSEEQRTRIENDRQQLGGAFCRGCGYCMPCPVGIPINNAARMSLLLRRSPPETWLAPEYAAQMARIEACISCRKCAAACPYGLDTPALLRENYEDYKTFLARV